MISEKKNIQEKHYGTLYCLITTKVKNKNKKQKIWLFISLASYLRLTCIECFCENYVTSLFQKMYRRQLIIDEGNQATGMLLHRGRLSDVFNSQSYVVQSICSWPCYF